eukprot:comp7450_c0_seq1/m.7573 comp7450_c0_seq1/g.7573  ORF comp7450_c0_seq1/g.7573 comp7450_c0_seq1/m.7573 type:complete len:300 (+) comp7450_c0_seq1:116-1015(+)
MHVLLMGAAHHFGRGHRIGMHALALRGQRHHAAKMLLLLGIENRHQNVARAGLHARKSSASRVHSFAIRNDVGHRHGARAVWEGPAAIAAESRKMAQARERGGGRHGGARGGAEHRREQRRMLALAARWGLRVVEIESPGAGERLLGRRSFPLGTRALARGNGICKIAAGEQQLIGTVVLELVLGSSNRSGGSALFFLLFLLGRRDPSSGICSGKRLGDASRAGLARTHGLVGLRAVGARAGVARGGIGGSGSGGLLGLALLAALLGLGRLAAVLEGLGADIGSAAVGSVLAALERRNQ